MELTINKYKAFTPSTYVNLIYCVADKAEPKRTIYNYVLFVLVNKNRYYVESRVVCGTLKSLASVKISKFILQNIG